MSKSKSQSMSKTNDGSLKYFFVSGFCIYEFMAEMFGTFILMVVNNSLLASSLLKPPRDGLQMAICGAMGAMLGIMASLPISGGHINPAVTVSFAVSGKFPWNKVLPYCIAQYLGSFLAQPIVYSLHLEGINDYDHGHRTAPGVTGNVTGDIYATYPTHGVGLITCMYDQVWGTAFLLIGVLVITDPRGMKVPIHLQPFFIALLIVTTGSAFGYNTGAILNPARDLSPRLFSYLVGYGSKVWSPLGGHYWWAVAVVAPHVGAVMGILAFDLFIGSGYEKKRLEEEESEGNGDDGSIDFPQDIVTSFNMQPHGKQHNGQGHSSLKGNNNNHNNNNKQFNHNNNHNENYDDFPVKIDPIVPVRLRSKSVQFGSEEKKE